MKNRTLLISLHQHHSKNVFEGKKDIELRKQKPRVATIKNVLIYETKPTGAIVGEFFLKNITRLELAEIIKNYKDNICLSSEEIENYLTDGFGWCISIEAVKKFKKPIPLSRMQELKIKPPQGYLYLTDDQVKALKS